MTWSRPPRDEAERMARANPLLAWREEGGCEVGDEEVVRCWKLWNEGLEGETEGEKWACRVKRMEALGEELGFRIPLPIPAWRSESGGGGWRRGGRVEDERRDVRKRTERRE